MAWGRNMIEMIGSLSQWWAWYTTFKEFMCLKGSGDSWCLQSVQLLSRVRLFAIPWTAAHQVSLSITNSQSLLKLTSIESVMPSNHLILRPLLFPPSIFPRIRVFFSESVLHIRWPKYWSFSFNISPSNEHSGLISFRMDWLDLLAVQGTLKSLPKSSAFSFLYSPTFTSILDYWKNHSSDYGSLEADKW